MVSSQVEETLQAWAAREVLTGWMQATQSTRSLRPRKTLFPRR